MRLVSGNDSLIIEWQAGDTSVTVRSTSNGVERVEKHDFATPVEATRHYKAAVASARNAGYRMAHEVAALSARLAEEAARDLRLKETRDAFNASHADVERWASDHAGREVPPDARIASMGATFPWGESCAWRNDVEWKGDLVLDEPSIGDPEAESLLFLGDLTVDGDVVNAEGETGKNLFVAGTLRARNLIAGGSVIWVRSAVQLGGCLFAHDNGGQLLVGGSATASLLVWSEHAVLIDGNVSGRVVREYDQGNDDVISALRQGRMPQLERDG